MWKVKGNVRRLYKYVRIYPCLTTLTPGQRVALYRRVQQCVTVRVDS